MRCLLARLAPICAVLLACNGTDLRAPLCHKGEFALPPGTAGRYRVAMTTNSAEYSGADAAITELVVNLTEEADAYGLTLPRRALSRLPKRRWQTHARVDRVASDGVERTLSLASCQIGGLYYAQLPVDNLFQLVRLDLSKAGITFTGLNFLPAELEQHGFAYHFVPKLSGISGTTWDFETSGDLIVDNRELTAGRRLELLSLAHPSPLAYVLTRIVSPSAFAAAGPQQKLRLKRSVAE